MTCWSRHAPSSDSTMKHNHPVAVRYCGGCNPRYDRVALVKRLEQFFPGQTFVPAQPGIPYPAVLVACGCSVRCANVADLAVPAARLIYLTGYEDLLDAKARLTQALEQKDAQSLTHQEVCAILPQRPPMLFVDTVSRLVPGAEAIASFYVRADLPAFVGHFPGDPVFPGVYTVEAAAQTADILLLSTDRYAGTSPLFMGIRKANFRRKIVPGDTLEIHASILTDREEMGIATCRGQVFVAGEPAADMELTLAMR